MTEEDRIKENEALKNNIGKKKQQILAFATMKGGTGKTTVCYNVACMLAEKYKVLCIDLDSQCNLSTDFGCDMYDETLPTIADIFERPKTETNSLIIYSPNKNLPNLDLIPSSIYLFGTEQQLWSRTSRETMLKMNFEIYEAVYEYYDYIIFDTGPNFQVCTQNCLVLADHVILVVDSDVNASKGAKLFMHYWEEARGYMHIKDNIDGLIMNNVERTKMSNLATEYVDSQPEMAKIKFKAKIPHTTRFKECGLQNQPIFLLKMENKTDEKSRKRAEKAMRNLIKEMEEKGIV